MMRCASEEVTTTVCATIEMSGCCSPVALAGAQKQVRARVVRPGQLELVCDGNSGIRSTGRCDGTHSADGNRQC